MRLKKKKMFSRKNRRRLPYISILTGAITGTFLAVGLIGVEPNATGMTVHRPVPTLLQPRPDISAVRLAAPVPDIASPMQVEESYGDGAARALASALNGAATMAALQPAAAIAVPQPAAKRTALQPAAQPLLVRTVAIGRGDTLMQVMVEAGAKRSQAHAAIQALAKVHNPRRLRPGQEITMRFETDGDDKPRLINVSLNADVARSVIAQRTEGGGFRAETVDRPLTQAHMMAQGDINISLYGAAEQAGVPPQVIVDLIRLFSFDIDFQRDIHAGDRFELLYDVMQDASGTVVKNGDVLYARLTVGGKNLPLYRFELPDGDIGYFNEKGESVKKALMKTPVDGARLSSRYGRRRHPILGYTKMHRGIDFAAPRGTPVMAAGDGKIERAGWNGSYGRYVRIRHNSEYKTAYAHLTRIARGVNPGRRIKQGQIIGYVGSTGRSTGPHLHYEVVKRGRQINPLGLKLPTGRKLTGRERRLFQKARAGLEARYAALAGPGKVAQSE